MTALSPNNTDKPAMTLYRGWRIHVINVGNKFTAMMRGPANESENLGVHTRSPQGAIDGAKDEIDRKLGGGCGNRAMAGLAGTRDELDAEENARREEWDSKNAGERFDGGPV